MAIEPLVSVTIDIYKGQDGSYQAHGVVRARTERTAWSSYAFKKNTPEAATEDIFRHIAKDLSPHKRGRKPRGYRALVAYEYGG